jgi:hypothetical protein
MATIRKKCEDNQILNLHWHIWFFSFRRNPLILWEKFSWIDCWNSDFKSHLEIKLIGAVSQEVLQTITQVGFHLMNMGYVSHAEAIPGNRRFFAYRNWFSWNQKHYPWKIMIYGVKPADNCDWSQWIRFLKS